jgi:hypothetical protein
MIYSYDDKEVPIISTITKHKNYLGQVREFITVPQAAVQYFFLVLLQCFWLSGRYLEVSKIFLISAVNFYYVINKLIILVSDIH